MSQVANYLNEPPIETTRRFLNRELGILEFNKRVFAQAENQAIPLLERLRYLCISSSNLDELFEIRVAGLYEQLRSSPHYKNPAELLPEHILHQISNQTHVLVNKQYQLLNETILPSLERENIYIHTLETWNVAFSNWAKFYFEQEILPLLTPLGLDRRQPFPSIFNKSLNFIITLTGQDAFNREAGIAIVQAPRVLPRLVQIPEAICGHKYGFIMLATLIQEYIGMVFPGMQNLGCYQFRVTRNSDLFVDEEEITNLRIALQGELPHRHFGSAVRLEINDQCPFEITQLLLDKFELRKEDCYRVNGPVNLVRLMQLIELVNRPDLKFAPFSPSLIYPPNKSVHFFKLISHQDILLHHPYQSFAPILEFLKAAANDPDVVAIKQTIYRTGNDSELMQTLIHAAQNGKEVTVIVELMARFDEQTNINWATRLEEVGAHVVYGIVGHKTHAKMLLILRREQNKLVRYAHLSTGNYHPRTAMLYTDLALLTRHEEITQDVERIFMQLTGLGQAPNLIHLWQSPFNLYENIQHAIQRETEIAKQGQPARIIAKMNALLEPSVIEALYLASQAGVQIDLIIRGVCALRPGVSGLSSNIRVRSVVGRFLEHSRAFYFYNNGAENVYLSSADWMSRNLFSRVEIAFPILDTALKKRVIEEAFQLHLQDTQLSWEMDSEGAYFPIQNEIKNLYSSQEILLNMQAKKNHLNYIFS